MKLVLTRIFLLLSLFFFMETRLSAQLEDRLQFHLGGSFDYLRIQNAQLQTYSQYFTITGGGHLGLWQSNDQIALSLNPNASLGLSFNNVTGFSVFSQVPTYIMLRTGAACTKYNEQKFGIGAGLGLAYTYVKERAFYVGNSFYTLENSLLNPVAAVQLTFQNDFRILTLRAYTSLLSYQAPFIQPFGKEKFNYDGMGLSILYNF